MKKLFSLILLSFIGLSYVNAQKHSVGISYDYICDGGAIRFAMLAGASSYHHIQGNKIGLVYSYQMSDHFSLNSGLQYQQNWMQTRNISSTGELQTWDFKVETINVPFLLHANILKYLFAEAGPLLNLQTNDVDAYGTDQQSGIGFSLAAGIQYHYNQFRVLIKPQSQIQSIIPFQKENYHSRIISNSISVALTYSF
ncbi:outer membrane beta-barrel protein [Marivirga arenosa]|uniref:Outer membrane beta-barrel protein n=1 Tax=Marivirga arenosa TaxID=3059076 RepID=A0AA51ZW37_9BACT|nr:outer membrane beta-barrel protein [Marivirga sp. BKB1-2]WNB17853.1 outer membrane beta-barrel protein [Marivirga sp. BKB1-2]